MSTTNTADVENSDDDTLEETRIDLSNLIFLPFHPTFKLIVMFSVVTKSLLGPIQSVYPIVYCWKAMDNDPYLLLVKFFYFYCADVIYGIDTFLHIVHRQVTDEAMRREHLPKSGLLILLDFAALIPFYRLVVTDDCSETHWWPNVLAFTESLILYRVLEYFHLLTTHSVLNMTFGFLLLLVCTFNCITCFWLLLTYEEFCTNCNNPIYDWRSNVLYKLNETDVSFTTYVYAKVFVTSLMFSQYIDLINPLTVKEFVGFCILVILGYLLALFIIMPKIFGESVLRLRRVCTAYPHVKRLVEETQRRNPSPKAHISVEKFYSVMWKKRSGITHIPEVILELPRYLRVDIKQNLGWALFYHSPTLRKGSVPFKRFICDSITQNFKLPGEKFFAGPHGHTNLYYLKSGIVQILSGDEGITPVLSVTSGTIFGDISFLVPHLRKKVIIKCLTYCEVMYLSRRDYIKALHKYPEDRQLVFLLANERLKHAKTLYACKQHVRGLDRAEDEGIFWVKRRWWELSDYIAEWKRKSRKESRHCDLPPEETVYHCAKYIGQLVLCTEAQLQTKSLFANVKFPWLLVPHSSFVLTWRKIVLVTVVLVLIIYPPNITRRAIPSWFKFFKVWTDLIYAADICISLLTTMTDRDSSLTNFASVMFARCKTLNFNLDLLATVWVEYITIVVGKPQFFYVAQFNRLIKIYIFFTDEFMHSDVKHNPMLTVFSRVVTIHFCFFYICSYVAYVLSRYIPDVTLNYFFGEKYCDVTEEDICDPGAKFVLGVALSWVMEVMFSSEFPPQKLIDVYFGTAITYAGFLITQYCKMTFVSSIYLKYREVTNFQNFVSNLKKYYSYYKIHHDLLKRLDRYLMCHWKYYQGVDVMHPNVLMNEPYDIYWKVQGEVAEKIIGESLAFTGADPSLVRDLAYAAKFLILPNNSTIFLFGVHCINVTWLVQGHVKCEYHDDNGELLKIDYQPGFLLSTSSVFLGKASLRTYTASTDCEILYIKLQDFYKIIKRYPNEWSHLDRCISEFAPIFDEMFVDYVKKHRDYQNRLRERIFHARKVVSAPAKNKFEKRVILPLPIQHDFWTEPESDFMQYWLHFRAIIVVVSIINSAVQGGSGAVYRRQLLIVGAFCDGIAWMDIVLKMFLAYYDHRGILIYNKQKCIFHYLTRGFWLDFIGAMPWHEVVNQMLASEMEEDKALLMNTFCKFAHIYILIGYFNYICDVPSINVVYITIFKWQLLIILTMFGACHYVMTFCVDLKFNNQGDLLEMQSLNTCWMPSIFELKKNLDHNDLHLIYAESLSLAQCGLMGLNFGGFHFNRHNLSVGIALLLLLLIFWYAMGYSLTLLVLNSRGNTLFQHGVSQLMSFLNAERVNKKIIDQAVAHFTYWWMRTKGINIHHLTNERIGVVFRQDLSYYFYKKTFLALDTLLKGGEDLGRHLASASTQIYILPGNEIIREMDLTYSVYVVHRGKVVLTRNGEKVATIGKGCIFGQLDGTVARPVRISAMSEDYADLLQLQIKQFQDIISDDVRNIITNNPTSQQDYMATKKHFTENPYDTVQYILRGRKTIHLPGMSGPMEAHHGNWYNKWLYLAWLVEPFFSVFIVVMMKTLKDDIITTCYYLLALLDLIFLTNFLFEFYTVELVVMDKKCVNRVIGYRKFKELSFYIDAVSLLVPLLSIPTGNLNYQLIKILRLKLLFNFHKYFCTSFKSKVSPVLMKFVIVALFLHVSSCGWIVVACRDKFPIKTPIVPESVNATINFDEWVYPENRRGGNEGCARIVNDLNPNTGKPIFVVPSNWHDDYVLAVTYVLLLHSQTTINSLMPVTIGQIYYQVIISFVIFIVNIWLMSMAMSFVYTRFRELYLYDYNVGNLITYLKHSGLSAALLNSVKKYTTQLWERQRGNWLPELAQQAPMCLREDLLCELYLHHLDSPPMFRNLPFYFRRQVAARLKRIVVFPGKCIVQEGDIFPCIYFIHEGEVEKWCHDKSGDRKLMSLLTTNGYFGQIPGLFPNFAFQFSYYSRTVVDMVYLHLHDWRDLLDGYPDIKRDLYESAKQFRKDYYGPQGKVPL